MSDRSANNEVTASELINVLEGIGVHSLVYQTGIDTVTIYATFSRHIVIAGPGAHDNFNIGTSTFNRGALYIGTLDEDNPGISVAPGATVDEIVNAMVAASQWHCGHPV